MAYKAAGEFGRLFTATATAARGAVGGGLVRLAYTYANSTNGSPSAKITDTMITLTKPIERKG